MGRYNYRLTSVRFEDANGLGLTATPTDGDFSGGEENDSNTEKVAVRNRGDFDCLVETDSLEQEMSMTLQMQNQTLTSTVAARIQDFFRREGTFAAAVSVDDVVWAFKTIVTFNDGSVSTTKTYPHCQGKIAFSEGNPVNTFSLTLTNYEKPTNA